MLATSFVFAEPTLHNKEQQISHTQKYCGLGNNIWSAVKVLTKVGPGVLDGHVDLLKRKISR